ncbi:MAG TPA: patatin-like phospholipase family protein [Polyangiaceae bacterium]|nr:patatin-like phospholipase family protein [Polyangiaceae bacterium]
MKPRIKNLVFGGTGVRNAAYVGGILALEEAQLYREVEAFAGTSSGSIIATLASLDYSPAEIRQHVLDLDFNRLQDGSVLGGPFRVLKRYGWHKAEYLTQTLGELIARKVNNPRASFADLRDAGAKRLKVIGTNLTRRSVRVFPDDDAWHMPVVDAVRISIAIPLFFEACEFENEVYVDGGVLWNLPLEAFDTAEGANFETLGFLMSTKAATPRPLRSMHDYVECLFGAMLNEQEVDLAHSPANRSRVIRIDDLGIPTTNFGITQEEKLALMERGAAATREYLSARPNYAPASGEPTIERRPVT